MEFEVIFKTFSPAEAQLVCSRLQAAGFDAEVAGETAALSMEGYSLTTGGIQVRVPSSQAREARALVVEGKGESA